MREDGFTLVEMLAALVAGSLLLISLGWAISTLGRQFEASRDDTAVQNLQRLTPVLTAWIQGALPPAKEGDFIAQPRSLSFVTAPPDAFLSTGPVRLKLVAAQYEGSEALFAEFTPAEPGATGSLPEKRKLLVKGYRNIRFQYEPSVIDPDKLPALIRARFTDSAGRTLSITALPRINADGACRFDPISMECR